MCDVVFITPNMKGNMSDEVLGTLQLSTILENKGISCEILQFFRIGDITRFDEFLENAIKMIGERRPKIVSFYTRCDIYHIDLRLAEVIKNKWKDIFIIFGGPQSDIVSVETIEQISYVDYVCCGEGENTIYPFFDSLLEETPDLSVPGLVYRKNGEVRKNPRPNLVENLDELPLIDYSSICISEGDENKDDLYFSIDVGRGCPFGCTYCSTKSFWGRKYRLKSPQRIFEEVKIAYEKFNIKRFGFSHDMFTLNRKSVIETCSLLKSLDFPIEWRCSARIDCIDKELIDIMIDAGMKRIFIGVETGSPRMQKMINKNLKLDNIVELIGYLSAKGIHVVASFIYGFPEETEGDLSKTMSLIRELMKYKTVDVQTHLCTFLAGTELTEKYRSEMTYSLKCSDITGNKAIWECQEFIEKHKELFPHFLEYNTDLRTKLQGFKMFFLMWRFMRPVYQYMSEKYPSDKLIEMYYDFADANKNILKCIDTVPDDVVFEELLRKDGLVEKFSDDENYDLISDFYRFTMLKHSKDVRAGKKVTDIFCFEPNEIIRCNRLQDYNRCIAIVSLKKQENGGWEYVVKKGI